ncbi:MAG TPA: LacI family DNA-binding transcriptional regulator [Bacillota bacterium]
MKNFHLSDYANDNVSVKLSFERDFMSYTMKDLAKLAGVSTNTVSRACRFLR